MKRLHWGAALLGLTAMTAAAADKITPDQQEYFESKIRPIFVNNCYECHSSDGKAKADLFLDSKQGMMAGGDSGPVLKPGDPEGSLFIQRVKSAIDPMPPSGQPLADGEIADLEQWVRMGAPDPRGGSNAAVIKNQADRDKARKHWAFQRVKKPAVPNPARIYGGKLKRWAANNPIDAFVLAGQESQGMLPAQPAEREKLIRRAFFDILGLPPTYEQVQAFVNDTDPDAWENVVNILLASPHYGERWGRYWLDVARYADTSGQGNRRGQSGEFIYAWTYRKWVIDAMNKDKPYDEFLTEQMAADRLLAKDLIKDKSSQAAMGFLTLGRRDRNSQEIVDDRIDVVTRGTLGLSVYCARCHNHKFDPVPTADYYSLYGVFNSSQEPGEDDKPILLPSEDDAALSRNPQYLEYKAQLTKLERAHKLFKEGLENEWTQNARTYAHLYMAHAELYRKDDKQIRDNRKDFEKDTKDYKLKSEIGDEFQKFISRKKEDDAVFGPWVAFAKLDIQSGPAFSRESQRTALKLISDNQKRKGRKVNPIVLKYLTSPTPRNFLDVAGRYKTLFYTSGRLWNAALALHARKAQRDPDLKEPKSFPDAVKRLGYKFQGVTDDKETAKLANQWEQIRGVMFGKGAVAEFKFDRIKKAKRNVERDEQNKFLSKMDELKREHNGSPPRAMVLVDKSQPSNERIMIKGNRGQRGDAAPRQFLEILAGKNRKPFPDDTSGRLELAQAIATKDNPLTARVMVNRIWLNHFGRGLVNTPSEFGLRAEAPSHPALLDWLAAYFMGNEGGPEWTMKKIHRLILLSNTYQQSSESSARYARKDPDNVYLHRVNRRRLDFESFRDGMLQVSGRLDLDMSNAKSVELSGSVLNYRRTLYARVDRLNLADIFKTFDFASPDTTAGQRANTMVAQQALFMLNNKMLSDAAHNVVTRREFLMMPSDAARVSRLYQLIFQRDPEPLELKLGLRFILDQTGGQQAQVAQMNTWTHGYGTFQHDKKSHDAFVRFSPFQFFDGDEWRASQFKPNSMVNGAGYLRLDALGGHPDIGNRYAAIRRWIAPRTTKVDISGTLEHYLDTDFRRAFDGKNAKEIFDDSEGETRKALDRAWDGVTGMIVHSEPGQVAKEIWKQDSRRNRRGSNKGGVEVKRGDSIFFVVFGKKYPYQDFFKWDPTVKVSADVVEELKKQNNSLQVTEWKSSDEFAGSGYEKPLSPWEKYAQVLLLSNELAFVD